MRTLMLTLIMAFGMTAIAQTDPEVLSYENPVIVKDNVEYTLDHIDEWGRADIKVRKFNDEGIVIETGKISNGKLHGTWRSYTANGYVLQELVYDRGEKVRLTTHNHEEGHTIIVRYKELDACCTKPALAQVTFD